MFSALPLKADVAQRGRHVRSCQKRTSWHRSKQHLNSITPAWITPSCLQFLGAKKRFHTAWVKTGKAHCEQMFSALPLKADMTLRAPHVRFVSKPEKLNESKCFPLFTQ